MNTLASDEIESTIDKLRIWKPKYIPFPYCFEDEVDEEDGCEKATEVNLADYIGKGCRYEGKRLRIVRRPEWNNPNERDTINTAFKKSCHAGGFAIYVGGWQGGDRMRNTYVCCRGRQFQARESSVPLSKQRKTQTSKPQSTEEVCGFKFHIEWTSWNGGDDGRWVLYGGGGCCIHSSHMEMEGKEVY
jgi:hypothetical protein